MTPNVPNADPSLLAELAAFPELNPGPVIRTDEDGVILLVNAAARALFGADELPGRRWLDVCPGVEPSVWQRVVEGADMLQHEVEIGDQCVSFTYRRPPNIPSIFIYGNDVTPLRQTEEALRHAEKMATLGTLAAGVAHELNNPAAAATRGADQLRDAFGKLQEAFVPLTQVRLTTERAAALIELVRQDRERSAHASLIDPLTRSDLEAELEDWLDERDVADSWELAPALVSLGYNTSELEQVAEQWGDNTAAVIAWIARAQPVLALAREIEEATRRISEIVKALKTYSFVGQAPVRSVDVVDGIENTLVMLRNKLKDGVTVRRDYAEHLPGVDAYGAELNQVWTNLIDNAVDAMGGKGTIVVRVRGDGDSVVVEIEDDGPGMPAGVRQRIFDPFFTTKDPGKGTGLGLSTSRNIVVKKHGGTIEVESRPGSTRFIVRLPIRLDGAASVPARAPAPEA
jgi:signal transduction histidine kinase